MKNKLRQSDMGGLLVLLLFGIFAVCILSVILTGAKNYRKLLDRDQESFEHRTAMQYVITKVHQADVADGIYVGDFDSTEPAEAGDTLFFVSHLDAGDYVTRIYAVDGSVRELFSAAEGQFTKDAGQAVLPAGGLRFEQADGLLTVHLTDKSGAEQSVRLALRGGKAVKDEK